MSFLFQRGPTLQEILHHIQSIQLNRRLDVGIPSFHFDLIVFVIEAENSGTQYAVKLNDQGKQRSKFLRSNNSH